MLPQNIFSIFRISGSTYTTQFKRKLNLKQAPVQPIRGQKKSNDVLQDFPMRDYQPQREKNFYTYPNITASVSTEDEESGHTSALRSNSESSSLPTNLHVRFGKDGFYHIQNNQSKGALPDDAYKPQEIMNRGTRTKELSASKWTNS